MSAVSYWDLALIVVSCLLLAVTAAIDARTAPLPRGRGRHRVVAHERPRNLADGLRSRRGLTAAVMTVQALLLVIIATSLTEVLDREFGVAERTLAIVLTFGLYLVFGQAVVRAFEPWRAQITPGWAGVIGSLLVSSVRPLLVVVDVVGRMLARLFPLPSNGSGAIGSEDEIRVVITGTGGNDAIESDEAEMVDAVLQLEDIHVREIMVPRVDIIAVERSIRPDELLRVIIEHGHSRIPVYRQTIDAIEGVLYAKDLLPFVIGNTEAIPLATLLRPPFIVPESKRINDLLHEMRVARVHVAIVADEYGGTAGLATIEDILEEIVGEIQDEFDTELPLFEVLRENELIADGRLAMGDVEDALDIEFAEDDYETLGGFVQANLGRLPSDGDVVEAEGIRVEVLEVEGRRVRRMHVTRVGDATESIAEDANGGALGSAEVQVESPDGSEDGGNARTGAPAR